MTDQRRRVIFCNDRYLDIYGLSRADLPRDMTGRELLELRRKRGVLDVTRRGFLQPCRRAGRAGHRTARRPLILVKYFALPNGGSVATHEDCTEQRRLSRKLSSTTQFLESVLDNVPVCVAAKNIEDGRYIFANRAFERFSRFSRDHIVGKRADEIFKPDTAAAIRQGGRSRDPRRRRPSPQRIRGRARLGEAHPRLQPRDRAQREGRAGIPDRAVRRRHRPPLAVARTGEHQEIPRARGRQHPGRADRRTRQRRPLSARQPQRRDHPQPPPRGCHRAHGRATSSIRARRN